MPWGELLTFIAPHVPVSKTVRPPFDLAMMLRIHCLQQLSGLPDLGAEDVFFETGFYRDFVGISGTQRIPDRGSILHFRHLLEEHELSPKILEIITTKNKSATRNPQMHQTKKGNQWHSEKKCHIGVNADSGLVHSVIGMAANVNDVTQGHGLLHGEEQVVFADAGYQGAHKRADYGTAHICSELQCQDWAVHA